MADRMIKEGMKFYRNVVSSTDAQNFCDIINKLSPEQQKIILMFVHSIRVETEMYNISGFHFDYIDNILRIRE